VRVRDGNHLKLSALHENPSIIEQALLLWQPLGVELEFGRFILFL